MRCVSYNIQYGVGLDKRYDLDRIVAAIRDADVICLQEVTRACPWNGGIDMVAGIEAAFADRYCGFHAPVDIEFGSAVVDGAMRQRRFQFGNMVISRWPLMTLRGHLLPRRRRDARLNLQRGALEALIATPAGLIRFHSVHIDHIDADERLMQIAALKAIAFSHEAGGAISGTESLGFPELPVAPDFLLMGDFNLEPSWPEYAALLRQDGELVDVSAGDNGWSWTDPDRVKPDQRLDYAFANPGLAARVTSARIDRSATGSDHMPLWIELG
jgi:endonuclease/exonuclease/phosphatase family metal-dependent hydrolase